jgi:hypothetical protein
MPYNDDELNKALNGGRGPSTGYNEQNYNNAGPGYWPGQSSVYDGTSNSVPPSGTSGGVPPNGTSNEMVFDETLKPYSGLPESYRDRLLSFLMPQLENSVGNIEGNIDDYTQNALGTYNQQFNQYIKDEIPRQVGNLANRGVLSSSVAENTLSQTYSDAARKSAGKGYETAMEAAKLKTEIPKTLGELLQYGQYSEDPTVMSGILADLLSGMMP